MTNEIKNVPKLRFPEFNEQWEMKKLGNLANIVRGASPRPISDPKWFDEFSEIGWLRISDVTKQNGKIFNLEQKISKKGQEKTRVLTSQHLLLSIAASVGKPVINYVKTGVHDGFLIFLNPLFNIEFMFYWLDNFKEKWQKYGQPGSQVNLNSDLVKSQKLYIPVNSEQNKISNFFSKLDQQIELEEKKLAKLEEQKKGYMQKIFSQELRFKDENGNDYPEWSENTLGEITNITTGSLDANAMVANGKYKFFTCARETYQIDNYAFDTEALLISGNGANVGYIHHYKGKFNAYQRTYVLDRIETNIYFLKYYLEKNLLKRIYSEKRDGNTPYITRSTLYDMEINIPINNQEQQKIGDFFRKLDELIEKQSEKIEVLKMRKKGFLQKMFV